MDAVPPLPPRDVLADPELFEDRARQLADRLRAYDPQMVLVWETPASTVLGHVVARELHAVSLRCVDNEGLASLTGEPPESGRVAIVDVDLRQADRVRALVVLAEQHRLDVVVAGAFNVDDHVMNEELAPKGIGLESTGTEGPHDG